MVECIGRQSTHIYSVNVSVDILETLKEDLLLYHKTGQIRSQHDKKIHLEEQRFLHPVCKYSEADKQMLFRFEIFTYLICLEWQNAIRASAM
jgi:hypothetical protein